MELHLRAALILALVTVVRPFIVHEWVRRDGPFCPAVPVEGDDNGMCYGNGFEEDDGDWNVGDGARRDEDDISTDATPPYDDGDIEEVVRLETAEETPPVTQRGVRFHLDEIPMETCVITQTNEMEEF